MTKMDFEGIKNKLDILAVIESDLGQGKKSGRYHLFSGTALRADRREQPGRIREELDG